MILDKNVAAAIDVIANEFAALEGMNEQLNHENQQLRDENDSLRDENEELKTKVKKLEEALIEAHLTGKTDGS